MKVNIALGLALIASALVVAALLSSLHSKNELINNLEEANKSIAMEYHNAVIETSRLNEAIKNSNLKLRASVVGLENKRDREATVLAKPKLVEKLIQKSYKERESRLECLTGGLCSEQ
jgi:polyribonucleotide nucleotidyltransferase